MKAWQFPKWFADLRIGALAFSYEYSLGLARRLTQFPLMRHVRIATQ